MTLSVGPVRAAGVVAPRRWPGDQAPTGAARAPVRPGPPVSAGAPPVPAWLLVPEARAPELVVAGRRRRVSFVDRTLDRLARVLGQLTLAQDGAGRGLLQRLDARVLLLAMVAVLLALGFVRHPLVLVGACLVMVALARASAVPVRAFLGRIGLAPVVAALVVAPATLSVVTPGLVVLPLWTWGGVSQGLTAQGLSSAAVLVARVASSVAVVMLVTATTAWTRLVAALGALGVPRVFVMLIAMAYRYLTLLLDVAAEMYTSRRARTLTVVSHARAGRSLLGASAGALVTKAHHLSDEVHQAMVARGYRGRARTLDGFRVGPADLAGAAATVGLVAGLLLADGALGR